MRPRASAIRCSTRSAPRSSNESVQRRHARAHLIELHRERIDTRRRLADVGKHVTLGVRPEDLEVAEDGHGIDVTVDVVEELGADAYIYGSTKAHQVDVEGEEEAAKPFIARVDGRRPPNKGETVYLAPKQGHVHVFDAESGLRLGD